MYFFMQTKTFETPEFASFPVYLGPSPQGPSPRSAEPKDLDELLGLDWVGAMGGQGGPGGHGCDVKFWLPGF